MPGGLDIHIAFSGLSHDFCFSANLGLDRGALLRESSSNTGETFGLGL